MGIGIHKPSQGYWVRVITAIGAGLLIAFSCFWATGQIDALDLPVDHLRADLVAPQGSASLGQGDTVILERRTRTGGLNPFERIGTAVAGTAVRDGNPPSFRVEQINLGESGAGLGEIARIRTEGDGFRAETARGVLEVPIVDVFTLKVIVVGSMALLLALLVYWLVGSNRKSAEFLIATDGEMKKVHWSTRREVIGSTWVVVIACFLIAAILFVIDTVFSAFFRWINVLET